MASFADQMTDARLMLGGFAAQAERLGKRGIDTDFITLFNATVQKLEDIESLQAACKARLKEQTAAKDQQRAQLAKLSHEARLIIKAEFPMESWKEFGINASR